MNRHYMKVAAPARLAAECARYFLARGYLRRRIRRGDGVSRRRSCRWRRLGRSARGDSGSARGSCSSSMRRGRCGARGRGGVLHEAGRARRHRGAGRRSRRPAARSRRVPRGGEPGQAADRPEGRALFHPIRVALTGEAGGPGAGSRRAGDRSRRASCRRRRRRADCRLPRAGARRLPRADSRTSVADDATLVGRSSPKLRLTASERRWRPEAAASRKLELRAE